MGSDAAANMLKAARMGGGGSDSDSSSGNTSAGLSPELQAKYDELAALDTQSTTDTVNSSDTNASAGLSFEAAPERDFVGRGTSIYTKAPSTASTDWRTALADLSSRQATRGSNSSGQSKFLKYAVDAGLLGGDEEEEEEATASAGIGGYSKRSNQDPGEYLASVLGSSGTRSLF